MKPWIILIVVAVATTVTASVAVPFLAGDSQAGVPKQLNAAPTVAVSEEAPQVEVVDDLNYQFGVMAQETEGKHDWIFKNTGKGVLELRNLGTDCSCTIAQIGKADAPGKQGKSTMLPVAPGASEPIGLTWNTRKIDGGYRKSARIGTNDPRQPEVTLSVEGKVYPAVVVVPGDSSVSFQTVSNDEDVIRKVALYSKDRPAMKITQVTSSNPALLEVHSQPMTDAEAAQFKVEAGQVVDVKLKASAKLGSFNEEILIRTDHPEKPTISLRASGKVTGAITFMPEKVVIREATAIDGGSTNLIVWVRGRSASIYVTKAPPGLDVAITPLPQPQGVSGAKFKMTVKVAPGTNPGQIVDEIVLGTDHPNATEIHVPVDVLVQSNN